MKKDELVETICSGCCDDEDGRCQRYPRNSRTCDKFPELEKTFKAGEEQGIQKGRQEVVTFLRLRFDVDGKVYSRPTQKAWQAQLKEWGIEEV